MPDAPPVTVIIPVYNDAERLGRLLDCLAGQTYPADRVQVIVVDNGSTQDIAAAVAGHLPSATLAHEPRPGSYAARNLGLQHATGQVLAFTDSDCLPRPDWLERGVACLQADDRLGLVAGHVQMFPADDRHPTGVELYDMTYSLQQADYLAKQHFGVTANVFTRRSVVDAVGPFDARLLSRGDREWGQRVWAAGYQQAYAPDAIVLHPARHSLRELVAKTRRLSGGTVGLETMQKLGAGRARRWLNHVVPPVDLGTKMREHRRAYGRAAAWRFYGAVYIKRLVTAGEEIRVSLGGKARR